VSLLGKPDYKYLKQFWLCIWSRYWKNSIFPSLHHFSIISPFAFRELCYCVEITGVILVLMLLLMMLMRDDSDISAAVDDVDDANAR